MVDFDKLEDFLETLVKVENGMNYVSVSIHRDELIQLYDAAVGVGLTHVSIVLLNSAIPHMKEKQFEDAIHTIRKQLDLNSREYSPDPQNMLLDVIIYGLCKKNLVVDAGDVLIKSTIYNIKNNLLFYTEQRLDEMLKLHTMPSALNHYEKLLTSILLWSDRTLDTRTVLLEKAMSILKKYHNDMSNIDIDVNDIAKTAITTASTLEEVTILVNGLHEINMSETVKLCIRTLFASQTTPPQVLDFLTAYIERNYNADMGNIVRNNVYFNLYKPHLCLITEHHFKALKYLSDDSRCSIMTKMLYEKALECNDHHEMDDMMVRCLPENIIFDEYTIAATWFAAITFVTYRKERYQSHIPTVFENLGFLARLKNGKYDKRTESPLNGIVTMDMLTELYKSVIGSSSNIATDWLVMITGVIIGAVSCLEVDECVIYTAYKKLGDDILPYLSAHHMLVLKV